MFKWLEVFFSGSKEKKKALPKNSESCLSQANNWYLSIFAADQGEKIFCRFVVQDWSRFSPACGKSYAYRTSY